MTLPLTVNEFYQLVLRDDASDSIGNFMRDIGDLNIDTTPWQPQHDSKKSGTPSTRTIHYVHPVNAPMAPPTAKAQKTQYLHKFGSVGLCLETCTIVEDVPMTDCFVVDDRLWVSESIDGDGCNVEVTFNIRFVKSTMFRRIIENATRSEFNKFWGQFGSMIELLESPSAEKELGVKKEELEEVITMVEDELTEEGQEMPLSKVIGLIRESSRRRSIMTKSPSSKRVVHRAEEASASPAANVVSLITKYKSENSQLVGLVFAFMLLLNFLAIWQMIRMNQFLSVLDDHLQKMSRANDALLSKLAADHVCK